MDGRTFLQLQAGAAALLDGRPRAALAHFAHAHVFGFLPCMLVSAPRGAMRPMRCHAPHALPCAPCGAMRPMRCHAPHAVPCAPCGAMRPM
eukprot:95646-Chlamydomonas_euryale.AAC.1